MNYKSIKKGLAQQERLPAGQQCRDAAKLEGNNVIDTAEAITIVLKYDRRIKWRLLVPVK